MVQKIRGIDVPRFLGYSEELQLYWVEGNRGCALRYIQNDHSWYVTQGYADEAVRQYGPFRTEEEAISAVTMLHGGGLI